MHRDDVQRMTDMSLCSACSFVRRNVADVGVLERRYQHSVVGCPATVEVGPMEEDIHFTLSLMFTLVIFAHVLRIPHSSLLSVH